MKRVSIFKPCDLEYPEHDKPVKYTEDFLREIASKTNSVPIVGKHYGKTIGQMSNFTFTDGELFVDADSSKSLQKFSPSFDDVKLIDKGDYYLASGGYLVEVASTVKPRLDNSKNGGSSMSDENNGNETIKILNSQVKDLNKELAIKENKLKANEEKLKAYDELEKEVLELRSWKETNSKIIDEQKPIIEEFRKVQEAKKEELLEKVSNGNAEIKAKFQNFSLEDLETVAGTQIHEQPAKGVGADNAPGLNEGDEDKNKPNLAESALEHYKKTHNGEVPSFLKDKLED